MKSISDSGGIVAIIPARGGSKRIPRKNLKMVGGAPLIAWSIRAALESKQVGRGNVFVSTDDNEIAATAEEFGAEVIVRPEELGRDNAWTEPVIQHAVATIEGSRPQVDLVVWMNACVPQLRPDDIDSAVELLSRLQLREVIAVNREGLSNSSVRVLTREALHQRRLSVKFGVIAFPYVDINTEADLQEVERLLVSEGRTVQA